MPKFFKVWVSIEEIDDTLDHYEDVTIPISLIETKTLREARRYVDSLELIAKGHSEFFEKG